VCLTNILLVTSLVSLVSNSLTEVRGHDRLGGSSAVTHLVALESKLAAQLNRGHWC
jgi:hypothetical protein